MRVIPYAIALASIGVAADDPCLTLMKGEASSRQA